MQRASGGTRGASIVSFLMVIATAPLALAQSGLSQAKGTDRSIDVQLFQGAAGPRPFLTLDSAQVHLPKQFSLFLLSNYQHKPFSLGTSVSRSGVPTEQVIDVVRDQVGMELGGAVGILDRVQLSAVLPFTAYLSGTDFDARGEPTGNKISGAGLGDLRLDAKVALVEFGPSDEFTLSVSPGVSVPTGDDGAFKGGTLAGRLRAVTEFRVDEFRAAALAGVVFRGKSETFNATVGHQLIYGLALEYRAHRQMGVVGEWFGRSGLQEFTKFYKDANPMEIDAAARLYLPAQWSLTVGAGTGLTPAIGAPKVRAFLGLAWAPDFRDRDGDGVYDIDDRCPDEPEDRDGFRDSDGCPEADNDGDGIPDAKDKCPTDAEDLDGFEDEDGCPEADNDGDGIPDIKDPCPNAAEDGRGKRPNDGCPSAAEDSDGDGVPDARDQCPDEPEDRDGFQDEDGCPDVDNDGDGIPDGFDGCPNEAEDADGFEDEDGCPDPDNDKDGIPDAKDKCPSQPETLNGNADNDGCPDAGAEIVRHGETEIVVRERVGFVESAAGPALNNVGNLLARLVAMVLRGHTDIAVLRIEVGGADAREKLQARAEAVVRSLVALGIDAGRLKAVGQSGPDGVRFIVERRTGKRAE